MLLCHSSSGTMSPLRAGPEHYQNLWTVWSPGPAQQCFSNRNEGYSLRIRKVSHHPTYWVPRHESLTSPLEPSPQSGSTVRAVTASLFYLQRDATCIALLKSFALSGGYLYYTWLADKEVGDQTGKLPAQGHTVRCTRPSLVFFWSSCSR